MNRQGAKGMNNIEVDSSHLVPMSGVLGGSKRPVGGIEVVQQREIETVNLAEKFAQFTAHWSPKIVGELNDCYVKLVKFQGDFIWHHHETEDEMFLVVQGAMIVRFRDRQLAVRAGEFVIIPHGIEHQTAAAEECHALLLEPKSVVNTGTVRTERTADLEWI